MRQWLLIGTLWVGALLFIRYAHLPTNICMNVQKLAEQGWFVPPSLDEELAAGKFGPMRPRLVRKQEAHDDQG